MLEPWPEALDELRVHGFTLVAATLDAAATSLDEVPDLLRQSNAIALLVGSEGSGLSAASLARADVRVRIPMASAVDSLNVAIATAILLYEMR
jgi:tRNA G18 (ribose-2'-O)-methylase SpoU